MGVDTQKTIDWFMSNEKNITYTWGFPPFDYGPRSVVDYNSVGSTDCSGGMFSALVYAGAEPNPGIGATPPYTTVNIGSFLEQNGYKVVYEGTNTGADGMWEYQPGDIVNMGAGSIEASAGAAGHIGVITNDIKFASVTAAEGAGAGPVACHTSDPIPEYWGWVAGSLTYFQVWRNTNNTPLENCKESKDEKKDKEKKVKTSAVDKGGNVFSDTITDFDENAFNKDSNRNEIDRIVIHHNAGTNDDAARRTWYVSTGIGTSAHYQVTPDKIWGCVGENYVAYHAGDYSMNQRSIGIEHLNDKGEPEWTIAEGTYENSAKLIAEICERNNIPIDREHIIGHKEVASTQCPGGIDIDKLIEMAKKGGGGGKSDKCKDRDGSNKPSNNDSKSGTKKGRVGRLYRYNDFAFGGIGGTGKKNTKKESTGNASNNGSNDSSPGSKAPPASPGTFGHIFNTTYVVVQPYGFTSFSMANPGVYPGGKHTGIDIHPQNLDGPADVFAPCDGEIRWTGEGSGMTGGGYMLLTTPNNQYIYMGHFSEMYVKGGDKVKKGDHIGKDTFVNAWHIHLEYSNSESIATGVNDMDPKDIIPAEYQNEWGAIIEVK